MKSISFILFLSASLLIQVAFSQNLTILDSSNSTVSFRGLSIAKDGSIWVSGSKGTIGSSTDAGKTWAWVNPAGFENRDFRDIEAFNNRIALAMAVDSPGIILRTEDAGISWKVVYENHEKGIFLDDMSFRNEKEGICAGDPLTDGRLVIISTEDGGNSWKELSPKQRPLVNTGEALFASSGSNIIPMSGSNKGFYLVTGGFVSNLWKIYPFTSQKEPSSTRLPLKQGRQTTGANALFKAKKYIMVAGGDFSRPQLIDSNLTVIFKNRPPKLVGMEGGYKSSIVDNIEGLRISCGTTGIIYHDGFYVNYPIAWKRITSIPFHVVRTTKGSKTFWVAGPGGKIGMVNFP